MPCSCQTATTAPTGEPLPLLADDCPVIADADLSQCCTDPESLPSAISDGATLPAWATDAGCYDTGVTLLGRVGNKLARLVGSGFLQIANGQVAVVPSVAIKIKSLWHRWWKTTPTSRPIVGEPLDFPYQVIADGNGDLHAIKGTTEEDSQHMWDASANTWKTVPISEIPKCQRGRLPQADLLELVGFEPITTEGAITDVRCLKGFSGSGLIHMVPQTTVATDCTCPGCTPEVTPTMQVATYLETPAADNNSYVLKCIDGVLTWVLEA